MPEDHHSLDEEYASDVPLESSHLVVRNTFLEYREVKDPLRHIFHFIIRNKFRNKKYGSMGPWFMDPWNHGSMHRWIHGSIDPWIHGSTFIHGFMDPWIHE